MTARVKLTSLPALLLVPLFAAPLGRAPRPPAARATPAWQGQGRVKPPVKLAKGQSCSTSECHPDIGRDNFVHGPVAIGKCRICHKQVDEEKHDFRHIDNPMKLCTTCHEMPLHETVHKPIQEGMCTACHNPHHSEHRALLKTKTVRELCAQCHEQSSGMGKKFVHGPVAAGACNLCHQPHTSWYPKLLNKKGSAVCLSCHTDLEQQLKGAKYWHRPVSEDCAKCHDPHSSDHPFQLKEERQALCLDCHKEKKQEIEGATVFHEALTTAEGCQNCHNTHASKFPKLLRKPVIDLCLDCHDEPQVRPDGSVVAAIGRRLRESKYLHGPIREGDCSSCHNPHGSKIFRILRKEYPQKFYAPFDLKVYNLCFSCHDARVFLKERTETLTNFRNGSRNLHYVHVNKKTKGRTCRACHNTHASNLPKHIAEKVPFGGWEIPIGFKKTPTGGSCAPGCHVPRGYDRLKPVKNEPPKKKQKPAKSGSGKKE